MSDETEDGLHPHEVSFLHAIVGAAIKSIREDRKNLNKVGFALFVFEEMETKDGMTCFGTSLVSSVEPTLVAEMMKDWVRRIEDEEEPADAE